MEDSRRHNTSFTDRISQSQSIRCKLSRLEQICQSNGVKNLYNYMQSNSTFQAQIDSIIKPACKLNLSDVYKIKPRSGNFCPLPKTAVRLPSIPTTTSHISHKQHLIFPTAFHLHKHSQPIANHSPKPQPRLEPPPSSLNKKKVLIQIRLKRMKRQAIDTQTMLSMMSS